VPLIAPTGENRTVALRRLIAWRSPALRASAAKMRPSALRAFIGTAVGCDAREKQDYQDDEPNNQDQSGERYCEHNEPAAADPMYGPAVRSKKISTSWR
jgi:hypothetical protein